MLSVLHPLVEHVAQTLAGDQSGAREIEVEEAQHFASGQLAREALHRVQFAGDVASADHRADGGAGHDVGIDAGLVQRAQHTNMGPSAGASCPERQTDFAVAHAGPSSARPNAELATQEADRLIRCLCVNLTGRGIK